MKKNLPRPEKNDRPPSHSKEKRDYFSDKDPYADPRKHPSAKKETGMDIFEEGQKNEKSPPRRKKAA